LAKPRIGETCSVAKHITETPCSWRSRWPRTPVHDLLSRNYSDNDLLCRDAAPLDAGVVPLVPQRRPWDATCSLLNAFPYYCAYDTGSSPCIIIVGFIRCSTVVAAAASENRNLKIRKISKIYYRLKKFHFIKKLRIVINAFLLINAFLFIFNSKNRNFGIVSNNTNLSKK